MPGVTQDADCRRRDGCRRLNSYKNIAPTPREKQRPGGEYQLAEHDSFKNHQRRIEPLALEKNRDIGGKSALNYLIYVEGVPFVEAVRLLCEEPRLCPDPSMNRWSKRPAVQAAAHSRKLRQNHAVSAGERYL